MSMKMTIGDFLLRRLKEMGCDQIMGVPGDFNLQFLEQIYAFGAQQFIGTCNELNGAYTADGNSRIKGISALVTTYGVGELSALNGVAGAYAENVPVVCITGAPPLSVVRNRTLVHHSLVDGNYNNMLNAYREFTVAQTQLTPQNAVSEIDRVLLTCWREKRPVYIQLPSDISHLEVDVPKEPIDLSLPRSSERQLKDVAEQLAQRYGEARAPALLVDLDIKRYKVIDRLNQLVHKAQIPYASVSSARAMLPESDPLWAGLYNGDLSHPTTRKMVEESDCLLAFAPRFIETNSGMYTDSLPDDTIFIEDSSVRINNVTYESINIEELIDMLIERLEEKSKITDFLIPLEEPTWKAAERALTQDRLWERIESFFREGDLVVAEVGTSNIGLGSVRMPNETLFISQPLWGSIGYSLPALFGAMLADRGKHRPILFIGDGSFQLTAQELSTILYHDFKPIIFLLNNRGYTIERYILGKEAKFNDIVNWDYTALPKAFLKDRDIFTAHVHNEMELDNVLKELESIDQLAFVELHLDALDSPKGLEQFGVQIAELNYGKYGPRP